MDLDLAKHHLDVLTVLEEKTKNNLSLEEQSMLDAALYENADTVRECGFATAGAVRHRCNSFLAGSGRPHR